MGKIKIFKTIYTPRIFEKENSICFSVSKHLLKPKPKILQSHLGYFLQPPMMLIKHHISQKSHSYASPE